MTDRCQRPSGCHVTSFSDAEAAAVYRFLDTLGSASLKTKNLKTYILSVSFLKSNKIGR